MTAPPAGRIAALDAIRGLAVLCVVTYHITLLWLGSISYPLYLVHGYPSYTVIGAFDPCLPHAVIMAAASLALASLVSYGVERPALHAIRHAWPHAAPSRHPPYQKHKKLFQG